ncbi:MAG: YdcF family protein [Acidobacteria bacterium]|nr:YdcF family protein [Acidobacteriota bacterium]
MFGLIFAPLRLFVKIVTTILTIVVVYFAVTFVQIWLTGRTHSTSPAQAILVFGTAEDNGKPSHELRARLDEALAVYRAGRASWFAVTGGNRPGDKFTEAGVSATYLEAHGVPKARIIVGGGDDTWQNVRSVASQLKAHFFYNVITVTDPFHEYRAMANASAQGLYPVPSPVENSPTIKHSLWRFYLKETLAVGVGRLIGYGRLSSWTTANHISLPFGG